MEHAFGNSFVELAVGCRKGFGRKIFIARFDSLTCFAGECSEFALVSPVALGCFLVGLNALDLRFNVSHVLLILKEVNLLVSTGKS